MKETKNNRNEHRKNKKTAQLVFTPDEHDRFEAAKEKLSATSAKDLVFKLLDKANL